MNQTIYTQAKVIDNTYYSFGFPSEDWSTFIKRDNFIAQIEDHLSKGVEIVFIEGDEDSGKTSLCAQFAKKHIERTISVFFNPLNNLDYSIEYYCTNIVCQIKNILKEDTESEIDDSIVGIEEYQKSIFELRKKVKNKGYKINLIIDGIEEKIKNDPDFVGKLFTLVPFGQEIFRIIISGTANDYMAKNPKLSRNEYKSVGLVGFTELEIAKYLSLEENYSTNQISNLFKVTKGYPGRLKTLKRLIQDEKYSLEDITQGTTYTNWVELDCESIDFNVPINNAILSLLSLSNKSFPIEEISKICSLPIEDIQKIVEELKILESSGKDICFVSNAHKKYFSNKLRGNKSKVQEMLIDYYASSENINHLIELPKLHAEKNDWTKIIAILNDDFLPKVLDSTGSLKIVNESLDLGVKASEKTNKYSDLWRYSIQGSIVNELDNYLFWESEIKARIAIQDFVGAISLAESAVLRIDRLRLLALIAKKQKQLNNEVDEELITLIQELYQSTDLYSVGNKIYDIVADLIYAIPNLAIEIIEKSSGDVSEKSINDWVVAKLSMAAIDSSLKSNVKEEGSKKLEAIESLNNPSVKKINRAISFLVGNYSAVKVLEEVKKLTDSKERVRLLRLWLNNNRGNTNDIERVIDMALSELVSSSSRSSINLDVLKDLSFQLPFVTDKNVKKDLLNRFLRIEKDVSDLGLTKNKYIYKVNIFHTLYTLDQDNAKHSINSILSEIDTIEDVLVKLESYGEVYSKLVMLKHNKELTSKISFVYSRIILLTKELFATTADHFRICHNLLQTIGKRNPVLGLKICDEINTVSRREKAKHLILDSYLENNIRYIKFELLNKLEESFQYTYSKHAMCNKVLERYSESKNLHYEIIKSLFYYGAKVNDYEDPLEKVSGYILMYKIISKNSEWKLKLSKQAESRIYNSWCEIEADWDRIDCGFTICSDLAKINADFSKKIFLETEKIKNGSWIDSQPVAYTYLNSVKLILKAFSGLLISKNDTKEDFKIIEGLISRIPSEVDKAKLWTEIGLQAYIAKRDDIAKNITDFHIILLLQSLVSKKIDIQPVLDSFTIIHLYNSDLSLDLLGKISSDYKEIVFSNISDFYVTKRNPFEPYESEINRYNSSYSDLTKAISIISNLDTDSYIFYQLRNICNAVLNNKSSLSKPQIADLVSKLNLVATSKFPDTKNIKHQGYVILANAKIAKLKKETINNNAFWSDILERTKQIPNASDMIYVKSILLEEIPFDRISGGNDIRIKLFNEIIASLNNFKTHYELINRVIDISDIMYSIDRNKWKTVVSKAFSVSTKFEDGSEVYKSQRSIIDSIYRIDPIYAKELIKLVDKDNPENNFGNLLHNHFETLEIAKKIKNNEALEQKEKENYRKIIRGIISALKSLNSEKLTAKKRSELTGYLAIGNKLPLHEVFPIFTYYLSNCACIYKETKLEGSVSEIHRENFIEAVKATNLIELLSHRRKSVEKSYKRFFIDEDFATNKAIMPNSRDEAFLFIKSWLFDQADEFVIIADPYLQKEDIEILKMIKEVDKDLEIDLLGSANGNTNNIEGEFQDYWKHISDEEPPFVNITFCWFIGHANQMPFHDRWILTKNSGMRLGTSINSLGKNKESELSIMKPTEALKIKEDILLDYINRRKRELNSFRLAYRSFNL